MMLEFTRWWRVRNNTKAKKRKRRRRKTKRRRKELKKTNPKKTWNSLPALWKTLGKEVSSSKNPFNKSEKGSLRVRKVKFF